MKLPNLPKRKKSKKPENGRKTNPANMTWIGIGNAGIKFLDKLCFLDKKSNLDEIYPMGIRTSKFDCQSPRYIEKDHIIDLGEEERRFIKGTGGNQSFAQQMFLEKKENILERISQSTVEDTQFFLLGSLAGGTGGGGIPVLTRLLKKNFPDNPIFVGGILPDLQEGSKFQANASRSLHLLEQYNALILFENRTVRGATIEEGFNLLNTEFARALYPLFAARPEEYALNPQETLDLIERAGKQGICLTHRHATEGMRLARPKTDQEKEALKSDILHLFNLNLSYYPEEILRLARVEFTILGQTKAFYSMI